MEDISNFLPFADVPDKGLKCKVTAKTTDEMLALFEQTCRAINKYSTGSVLGQFLSSISDIPSYLTFELGGLLGDRIEDICSFKEKLGKLKETFGWCLTTEIWKTALKIGEKTSRGH